MANIKWTPPAGWKEQTGARVQFLAPCNCSEADNLIINGISYIFKNAAGVAVNKIGGAFMPGALVEAVLNCENGAREAYLVNEADALLTTNALPADGVPHVNVLYFLGELTGAPVEVKLPTTATPGDMLYIAYSAGATQPNLTVTGAAVGLQGLTNLTHRSYELMGLYSGSFWLFVVREVGL